MTNPSGNVGAQSRILLTSLDIEVSDDGQLIGETQRAREAVEGLLIESVGATCGPLGARLRAALGADSRKSLSRRDRDALAVIHNRLLA